MEAGRKGSQGKADEWESSGNGAQIREENENLREIIETKIHC